MDLDRIQTVVDAEHTVSHKWVERMGFKNEGLMRKYLGGRDFYRYALIREK
jgi:RimJ/RimL family protein N-acetyltransferase